MLNPTIYLPDTSATYGQFVLTSQGATFSTRMDTRTNLAAPRLLSIKHSTSGSGKAIQDRTLVQTVENLVNAAGGNEPLVINTTMSRPRFATALTMNIVEDAMIRHLTFFGGNHLSDSDKILVRRLLIEQLFRGEV